MGRLRDVKGKRYFSVRGIDGKHDVKELKRGSRNAAGALCL
jgi:hypothetical protein